MKRSNKPDAADPAVALCLTVEDQRRRVPHPGRWTTERFMKTFTAFLFSATTVCAGDIDIRVVTTTTTNAVTGKTLKEDVFTRDNETNSVCHTATNPHGARVRIERFYHAGVLIGTYESGPESSWGLTVEPGVPFLVTLGVGPLNEGRSLVVAKKDGIMVEWFTRTNGLFYPVEGSRISKANATIARVMKHSSPADLRREFDQIIEKHRDK